MWDTVRSGQYEGVPFKWATPDPIWQTIFPLNGENYQYVHPPEKQPYIGWIVRLACYAELKGKSLDYVNEVSPLIWGDQVEHWPAHVKEGHCQSKILNTWSGHRTAQIDPKNAGKSMTTKSGSDVLAK